MLIKQKIFLNSQKCHQALPFWLIYGFSNLKIYFFRHFYYDDAMIIMLYVYTVLYK